jgi:hypothetical protein
MVASARRSSAQGWPWLVIATALLLVSCGRAPGQAPAAPDAAIAASAPSLPEGAPASCRITRPPDPPFVPPAPYSTLEGSVGDFWYGTPALWTALRRDGTWELPYNDGAYGQKVFWWRQGYDWRGEPQPPLTVTGRRIDGSAGPLVASSATNAFAKDIGSAMLVGVRIPAAGCWQVTGRIEGADLSFVVWVPA